MRVSSGRRLTAIGFAIAVVIGGAVYLVIAMERAAYIDSYQAAAINLGMGMAAQTDQLLGQSDSALRRAQQWLADLGDTGPEAVRRALREQPTHYMLVAAQQGLFAVDALVVVDADGVLAASSGSMARASDAEFVDAVRHFATEGDPSSFAGRPVRNAATGRWQVLLARPIHVGGAFAGIVGALLSLDDLADFYRTAMPPKRSIVVFRRDGVVLLTQPPRPEVIGRQVPDSHPWHELVAKGGGSYRPVEYFSGARIIAFLRPLRNAPFVVEVAGLESEALAEWYSKRIWPVLGGVAALLLMVWLLRLFGAQLHRLEVSERALATRNRQVEIARFQLDVALSTISQGLCFFSADQRLVLCNPAYGEMFGLSPHGTTPGATLAEIAGHCVAAGAPATLYHDLLELHAAATRTDGPMHLVVEMADARVIAIVLQPTPDGGWVATHEDITARRTIEAQTEFLAKHDLLTGLVNRASLEERIAQALIGRADGVLFALLFLDLDRFKAVNDNFGHLVGDHLLRAVAGRLLACVRDGDTVARLGGDEFVVLQVGLVSPEDAAHLARRIIESVAAPYGISGHDVEIGVSIGIEVPPDAATTPEALIALADFALYQAKKAGRGTFRMSRAETTTEV